MKKKVILLGLNEINFEFVKSYCNQGLLPNFKQFIDRGWTETTSEQEYKLFEPWIQWVTVYTGKSYSDHQVFRLGDIVERKDLEQIFEQLEAKNLSVAAVSPFNADNRLKKSPFFIPDPWTKAPVSGTKFIKKLSEAVQQSVNDNAQSKMTAGTALTIIKGFAAFVSARRYLNYFSLVPKLKKPGVRAIVLDNLLADVFIHEWRKHAPDFSNLFLNAAAHIQHHYLFNSSEYVGEHKNPEWYCPSGYDPVLMALQQYDKILGELNALDATIYLVTGLHQRPHEHITYYWRLKDHKGFMDSIGLKNVVTLPRMSRDFLMKFSDSESAAQAQYLLESFKMITDGEKIFEVDNRGTSLFVELVYPNDLDENMSISNKDIIVNGFKKFVSFVAIKNGEHDPIGYLLSNNGLVPGTIPLTDVYEILKESCLQTIPQTV
jgi:hypothetical protein